MFPFLFAVCSRIGAKQLSSIPKAALYFEIGLSLWELSLTTETWNVLFSRTLLMVVKAQEGVSKPALPSSRSFDPMAGFNLLVFWGRWLLITRARKKNVKKKKKLTPMKSPLLAFSPLSCCACGNSSLDPVLVIAVPWDRRFHFPSCFPGCGKTSARCPQPRHQRCGLGSVRHVQV